MDVDAARDREVRVRDRRVVLPRRRLGGAGDQQDERGDEADEGEGSTLAIRRGGSTALASGTRGRLSFDAVESSLPLDQDRITRFG